MLDLNLSEMVKIKASNFPETSLFTDTTQKWPLFSKWYCNHCQPGQGKYSSNNWTCLEPKEEVNSSAFASSGDRASMQCMYTSTYHYAEHWSSTIDCTQKWDDVFSRSTKQVHHINFSWQHFWKRPHPSLNCFGPYLVLSCKLSSQNYVLEWQFPLSEHMEIRKQFVADMMFIHYELVFSLTMSFQSK